MKPKSETNMKNTLFNITTHKDFKWVIISSVIIINFIGLMVGSLLAGQSYTHIESLVINGERSYEIYPYPMSNEIIITANSTNTENLNFTGFARSTLYTDPGISEEFILRPGESVSILQDLAVGDLLDISFQKPSEPQGVIISIRGCNRTLIELLRGFSTPEFTGFSMFLYVLFVIIPSILLSYLVFFIALFYIRSKQLHKTSSGKTFLIEIIAAIIYLTCWFIVPLPPIPLFPVIIFVFLCSVIVSQKFKEESRNYVVLGVSCLITALLLYWFYNPLVPNYTVNNQEILEVLPIFPLVISLLSTGVFTLFIGVRLPKFSRGAHKR